MTKRFHPRPVGRVRAGLLAALLIGTSLGLGACNRQEDPADTAKDMGEARQEGTRDVQEAARDAAENRRDGTTVKEAVTDAYKVESERIEADYEVAKERCDGMPPGDQDACRKQADEAREAAMKALEARRDSVVSDEAVTDAPMTTP